MHKRLQLLALILSLINLPNLAQPSASLYFTTAIPVDDFSEYNSNVGFGGAMELFLFSPSEKLPYGFGINLSYIGYGIHFLEDPDSEHLDMSFNKANNFASAHILFQIAPHTGSVRPYFETLFGGSYIFSRTEMGYAYHHPQTLWVDDWVWSYGWGVGLKLLAHGDPVFNSGSVYLDLKVRYMMSTETTYLDRNSVAFYDGVIEYNLIKSKTDMVIVFLGLFFFF
ncbi:MAG: hypothetical protein JSW63_04820 [Ignavibacterium sp.]|nr:MAG: hypothetical protein JSW63_04820 [Ignavibacterium sp.]